MIYKFHNIMQLTNAYEDDLSMKFPVWNLFLLKSYEKKLEFDLGTPYKKNIRDIITHIGISL